MVERHRRAQARAMLTKAGYKSGGHFKPDGSPAKRLIGEAIREHEDHDHKGEPKTKLKFKSGGSVMGMPGPRIHKPRSHKPKKPHTQVNVVVAGGGGPKPVPVPVPIGGPPPVGPGAPMPPGGLPGQMPPGANRGGRFAKGGTVKEESQRDPIKTVNGKAEGKLCSGGKAKKLFYGGSSTGYGNTVMGMNPPGGPGMMGGVPGMSGGPGMAQPGPVMGGPGTSSGPGSIMKTGPGGGGIGTTGGGPGMAGGNPIASPGGPAPRPGGGMCRVNEGLMNRGGKAKVKPVIDDGAGGGLGRLEKAQAYGAKVKHGGKAKR